MGAKQLTNKETWKQANGSIEISMNCSISTTRNCMNLKVNTEKYVLKTKMFRKLNSFVNKL